MKKLLSFTFIFLLTASPAFAYDCNFYSNTIFGQAVNVLIGAETQREYRDRHNDYLEEQERETFNRTNDICAHAGNIIYQSLREDKRGNYDISLRLTDSIGFDLESCREISYESWFLLTQKFYISRAIAHYRLRDPIYLREAEQGAYNASLCQSSDHVSEEFKQKCEETEDFFNKIRK